MHLTLLVPGLLLPVEILENTVYDLAAPTLSTILGSGGRHTPQDDWLPRAFGLDDLSAAALRKVGSGGTATTVPALDNQTAQGEWLCLDPVHWMVGAQGVTLDDPARLALSPEESAALIEAMQPLFADWGELSASAPGRWELHLQRPLALETQPLPLAIQQPIDPALPGGADGAAWRLLLAEAQTVLHTHPVNRCRDDAGRPTVNSLWPWGQGALPAKIQSAFDAVWSDDPVIAGLCRLANLPCQATPPRLSPFAGHMLAIIDTLAAPARTFDALAWRDALLALERDWLAPALANCEYLRLVGTRLGHAPATVVWELKRSDRWRFWRKPRPLTELK